MRPMKRHRCARCPVQITAARPLCNFCTRTDELRDQLLVRTCLRCRHTKPLDAFGLRLRLCDDCRLQGFMTAAERLESSRVRRFEWRQHNRRRERLLSRQWQRSRAA